MGAQVESSSLDSSASLEDENITSLVVEPHLLQQPPARPSSSKESTWHSLAVEVA